MPAQQRGSFFAGTQNISNLCRQLLLEGSEQYTLNSNLLLKG